MKLSEEQVLHIAKLSRLSLDENLLADYQDQLGSVLNYVQKLQKLDTSEVPEMAHAVGLSNVFREDVVEGCEPSVREAILDNFPRREGDLLEVQAVFDERTE